MKLRFDQFAAVIAEIESGNNPQAWGDAGRAMGRYQQHPAFVAQWHPSSEWTLGMTWDVVCLGALMRFYTRAVADGVSDTEAAQNYHLHGQPTGGNDSPAYAERFTAAAAKLGYAL